MGQQEVVEALEGRGWITAKQVQERVGNSLRSTQTNLHTLVKHQEVECDHESKFGGTDQFKYRLVI